MNDIEHVSIYWSEPITHSELEKAKSKWYDVFYAISKGDEVMYIGIAYKQYIPLRLSYHHKLDSIVENEGENEIRISFGEYVAQEGGRMSKRRVQEIENLLIYRYKPRYNEQCRSAYGGRYLIIHNSGPGNLFEGIVTANWVDENDRDPDRW